MRSGTDPRRDLWKTLDMPISRLHAVAVPSPGAFEGQDTMVLGKFLRDVVGLNPDEFPDLRPG